MRHKNFCLESVQTKKYLQNLSQITSLHGEYLSKTLNLLLRVSARFYMKISFQVQSEICIMTGVIVEENGKLFTISEFYRTFFVDTANQNKHQQGTYFTYSEGMNCIKLKSQIAIKPNTSVPIQTVCSLMNKIEKMLPSLNLAFQKIGIGKKYQCSTRYIKKAELKLKKQLYNHFSLQVFTFLEKKNDVKNNYESCLKSIDDFKLIQKKNKSGQGSYFKVEKALCQITYRGVKQQKQLAMKTLIVKKECEKYQKYRKRLEREWNIISNIKKSNFFLDYWSWEEMNKEIILMNYVDESLEEHIYGNKLNALQIIDFSKQIAKAIQSLHDVGIIHRDLKPENILIEKGERKKVKIIDFSQATLAKDMFNEENAKSLGCTFPFSPIQCSIYCKQGFNKKQIDYWSVAMIIHEMIYKKSPISKTKSFLSEGNCEQFLPFVNFRRKSAFLLIEQIVSLISYKGICLNQKNRLNLLSLAFILDKIQSYFTTVLQKGT